MTTIQIWNHKLDKHTGQSFNFNNLDKVGKKNLLFNLLAEQNNDVLEEVISMKNDMIKKFCQLIDDFEVGMNVMRNETRKHTAEIIVVLKNIQKQVKNLNRGAKLCDPTRKRKPAPPLTASASPSPKPSRAAPPPSNASRTGTKKPI